jgi:hypothetical protein
MTGVRTPGLQRETWRFLCHEATREGFWDAVDEKQGREDGGLRIGRTLARFASRDADARLPADRSAAPAGQRTVSA